MERVILKNSRWQFLLLLLASLGFVTVGFFTLLGGKSSFTVWAAIVGSGACALIFAWQLVDARPRLIINENGITDRLMGVGMIPWSDVDGAYVHSISGNDFICLILRDAEKYAKRLSPTRRAMSSANRALGFTDFTIYMSGVNARIEEVFELVMKRAEVAKRAKQEVEVDGGSGAGTSVF